MHDSLFSMLCTSFYHIVNRGVWSVTIVKAVPYRSVVSFIPKTINNISCSMYEYLLSVSLNNLEPYTTGLLSEKLLYLDL